MLNSVFHFLLTCKWEIWQQQYKFNFPVHKIILLLAVVDCDKIVSKIDLEMNLAAYLVGFRQISPQFGSKKWLISYQMLIMYSLIISPHFRPPENVKYYFCVK